MSTDDKKRAMLDFGDLPDRIIPPVDSDAVKAVTRAAGFREAPKALAAELVEKPISNLRRTRRKTGRTEQFATRLRAETITAIYAFADRYEITLAETIERAIVALNRE